MKKLFFWTVTLLSVIYSCTQKEIEIITPEEPGTELIQLTVRASIGETDGTKTAIQPNKTSIFWTPGDAINLFYGELSAGQFTTSITEPAPSANFNGTLSVATGTTESGMSARRFWGVYPYNVANSCDGDGVILTIPSAQQGVPNTFADKLNPTVATSAGLDLGFYNVGSWFIFSVTQENVVSATLQGNTNEDIAGTIRVTMDGNSRPVASVQSGAKSITITPQTGDSFVVGEEYYMVLIPQTLSGGYTLTLTKADGSTAQCVKSNEAAFVRSQYRRKSNADDGLIYIKTGNIDFADAAVKTICVNNWDTNSDGELSYAEAAAVTSIPYSTFAENTTITSFDEFQYFTGLTSLNYTEERDEGEYDYFGTFYRCTNLASIILPPTLKTISAASFLECTSLSEITIPASVTNIQALAFLGCENLDVYMESETPCILTVDPRGTYDHPYSFGFLANGLVKTIYVPTEACLDTYKSATYWTSYKWRIKWVGEFVPTAPVPEAVDLGLSVKWASFNVGASSPEEYGDYYAWGETKSKEYYTWSNYKYCNGSENFITKYTTVDNKTNLEPEDDVASVKWGRPWRMPTEDEWAELRENCTWTWTDNYNNTGVPGRIVTSNKEGYTNKSIFLPAAGYMASTTMMYLGTYGTYWSSSLQTSISSKALDTYFQTTNYVSHGGSERNSGRSVRPVSAPFNPSILITSIQLNKTETVITGMGNDETLTATVLPSDASYKVLSWTSSNTSVATVNSDGVITAVAAGSATITVSATDGSDVYATCDITVSNIPVPEAVDLGLSVKWASFNVGASAPEEYGDYYAWGEIKPHYASLNPITWKEGMSDGYNWSTYKWYGVYNNQEGEILKYNGAVDNKTMLDLEDDVAHITLGGHWRMPTREEFNELMENCTWTWTSINGVNGFLVTSNVTGYTNNSIFFPGAGRMYPKLKGVGNYGWYWSSTGAGSTAWYLYISQYGKNGNTFDRCDGRSVRPVFAE